MLTVFFSDVGTLAARWVCGSRPGAVMKTPRPTGLVSLWSTWPLRYGCVLGLYRAALHILSVRCHLISEAVAVERGCKSGHLSPRVFADSIKISLKRHPAHVVLTG